MELENERVRSSRIREIFKCAELGSLILDKADITISEFLSRLSEKQAKKLVNGLLYFGRTE